MTDQCDTTDTADDVVVQELFDDETAVLKNKERFCQAVRNGGLSALTASKQFLACDVNFRASNGETPLMAVARRVHSDDDDDAMITQLLMAHSDIDPAIANNDDAAIDLFLEKSELKRASFNVCGSLCKTLTSLVCMTCTGLPKGVQTVRHACCI